MPLNGFVFWRYFKWLCSSCSYWRHLQHLIIDLFRHNFMSVHKAEWIEDSRIITTSQRASKEELGERCVNSFRLKAWNLGKLKSDNTTNYFDFVNFNYWNYLFLVGFDIPAKITDSCLRLPLQQKLSRPGSRHRLFIFIPASLCYAEPPAILCFFWATWSLPCRKTAVTFALNQFFQSYYEWSIISSPHRLSLLPQQTVLPLLNWSASFRRQPRVRLPWYMWKF